eukprot:scaffold121709_cov63-Phaeocystis_antarctica.AAC.2
MRLGRAALRRLRAGSTWAACVPVSVRHGTWHPASCPGPRPGRGPGGGRVVGCQAEASDALQGEPPPPLPRRAARCRTLQPHAAPRCAAAGRGGAARGRGQGILRHLLPGLPLAGQWQAVLAACDATLLLDRVEWSRRLGGPARDGARRELGFRRAELVGGGGDLAHGQAGGGGAPGDGGGSRELRRARPRQTGPRCWGPRCGEACEGGAVLLITRPRRRAVVSGGRTPRVVAGGGAELHPARPQPGGC